MYVCIFIHTYVFVNFECFPVLLQLKMPFATTCPHRGVASLAFQPDNVVEACLDN